MNMSGNITDVTNFTSNLLCPPPSPEELRQIEALDKVKVILSYTAFSVALVLGLPGSILTVITILLGSRSAVSPSRSRSTVNPFTVYMCTLAASDFISLILASFTIYKLARHAPISRLEFLTMLVYRIFQSYSHWLLALICLERFIAVRFPLQKSKIYTTRTVIFSTLLALVLSAIPFTGSYLILVEDNMRKKALVVVTDILNILIYSILPCIFILVFSFLIAFRINRNVQRRETMMAASNSRRSVTMETQLTRIMFITAVCFIVFTFPWAAINIHNGIRISFEISHDCPLPHKKYQVSYYSLWAVSFLNNALNFYLYIACAKGFRDQFKRAICCKKSITRDA